LRQRTIRLPSARSRLRAHVEAHFQGPAGDVDGRKREEVIGCRGFPTQRPTDPPDDLASGGSFFFCLRVTRAAGHSSREDITFRLETMPEKRIMVFFSRK